MFLCNVIFNFSLRHSEHFLLFVLYAWCVPKLSHMWLNDFLWFAYRSLNAVSQIRRSILVFEFSSGDVMSTLYKMLLLRQFSFRGHYGIVMQLQVLLSIVDDGWNIFLFPIEKSFLLQFPQNASRKTTVSRILAGFSFPVAHHYYHYIKKIFPGLCFLPVTWGKSKVF